MKKSVLMFSLLSGTALMFPRLTIASGILPTHTGTPEPKPAFQFEQLDKAYKTAGICFLGVGDCDPNVGFASSGSSSGGNDDYTVDTSNQCLNEGFSKQNCNSVQTIDGVCPYNSAYGLGCKCASNLVSCPAGQVGVGESCDEMYASCECDPALVSCSSKEVGQGASCGGRYESCVCKDMYLYNSSNCSYPRSVSGDSCGGKYTDCVCPAGVDEGQYGCAEYYPSPCSSVCKVAYSDNCHIRSDDPNIALGYGCMKEWDDCSSKCERAYTDMCRERTAVISSCPDNADCSYFSDCSSKIQNWSCKSGYSKSGNSCVKNDPCDNRTAAISSCPSNASCSYYSDCPSKISSWSCNSGYEKEGSRCTETTSTLKVTIGFRTPISSGCNYQAVSLSYKESGQNTYKNIFSEGKIQGSSSSIRNVVYTSSRVKSNGELEVYAPDIYCDGTVYRFCNAYGVNQNTLCTRNNNNVTCHLSGRTTYEITYQKKGGSCPSSSNLWKK